MLIVLAAYALSRALTTLLLVAAYAIAIRQGRPIAQFPGDTDFLDLLQSWDGLNYREIALDGYPSTLPENDDGLVQKNVWAFLPLYPLLIRSLLFTGLDAGVIAVALSIAFGGAAAIALFTVLSFRFDESTALWGAVLLCFSPLSFVLQVAYAESMFLLLMFGALAAMQRDRWWLVAACGVAAAFTHPGALAIACAVVVAGGIHLVRRERPLRSTVAPGLAAVVIAAAGFSWPVIVDAATGETDAYFRTELAWWRFHIGDVEFVPFSPWFLMAGRYLGPAGIVAVIALMLLVAVLLRRPGARRCGTAMLAYLGSYAAYLFAVFLPQQSLFRMLLPLAPALAAPLLTATRSRRIAALAVAVVLQPVAIQLLWVIQPP
ncbi:glycosyltransferase family protein [Marisediminicola senii]|uniref:hypothetical protein n=1 Tax=Marisediminicola senii TaxID=2711233 RepID=UPI0013ED92D7|nr:hypothetical protein [Marisediminicola senii]